MASLTQWTWIWATSGRWRRANEPGVLQFMGSQRVGHNWAPEQQQSWLFIINGPFSCDTVVSSKQRKYSTIFPEAEIRVTGCSNSVFLSLSLRVTDGQIARVPPLESVNQWVWARHPTALPATHTLSSFTSPSFSSLNFLPFFFGFMMAYVSASPSCTLPSRHLKSNPSI